MGNLPSRTASSAGPKSGTGGAWQEKVKRTAALIYTSYPDYGKAPQEFTAAVMEHLSTYYASPWVLDALADPKTGIATTTLLMPSVSQIAEFAKDAIGARAEKEAFDRRYDRAQAGRQAFTPAVRAPFRPYPALWAAFDKEPEIITALDDPHSFDWLTEASRTLAVRGMDAARDFIQPKPDPRYADLPNR